MSLEKIQIDHCIIGGGIIGLFMALELHSTGRKNILILETSQYLGDHTTGRNSGVLHAGIYYPNNSLKHQLCIQGNELWNDISQKFNIPINRCGKYIISSSKEEENKLHDIYTQGIENKVTLNFCDRKTIHYLNEKLNSASAIYSPNSGILDIATAVNNIAHFLEAAGVIILKRHEVKKVYIEKDFIIPFEDFVIQAKNLYNHAGLHAIKIRKDLNCNDLQDFYVKGNYVKTTQKLNYSELYYPLPTEHSLGVHSTLDMNGDIKFGPNVEIVNEINYDMNNENLLTMQAEIIKTFKYINIDKLYLDYCGIRPKILFNNQIFSDFWIKSPLPSYIESCGIESPGVTAAPAIAKYIVNMISDL